MKTEFTLKSTEVEERNFNDYKGKYLVLYFYPRDNTKGCTIEANNFSNLYEEFKKLDAEVVGISKDSIKSHMKFKEKENIPYELLSDPEREVHANYEVLKNAKMYGKEVTKTLRSTFVFDKDLNLIKEYRDVKASENPQEVLDFIKSL